MLDDRKIRLMTRMTVYEEGLGVEDTRTARYFRNDYVLAGMIGSFVTGTLAWGICAAVYCGYFFEQIFFSVYENTLGPVLRFAATSYVAFMALYMIVSWIIFYRKSADYARRRDLYEQDLDELDELY